MATFTGTEIRNTYDSILKLTDNDSLTASLKNITDGIGNATPLSISQIAVASSVLIEATGFKTPTGTSSQFLKANGTIDNNTYLTIETDPVFLAHVSSGITATNLIDFATAYTHSQSAHAPVDAEKNVQSDWDSTSGDSLILNKPIIPSGNSVIDWTLAVQGDIHPSNYVDNDTTYVSSDFTHNDLSGVVANEHIDWTADQGTVNIHSSNYTNTTYVSSDFTHDNLTGYVANEHIDWTTDQGAVNIHANNYINTTYTSSDFNHDDLTGYVSNEHIDWTADQGVINIHANNYINTTYTSSDFTHNDLSGVAANEHIDWTSTNTLNIHPDNYTNSQRTDADIQGVIDLNTNDYATNTALGDYLPLVGGTLTGALSGTSANFSGNVGIGTSSPLAKLEVKSSGLGSVVNNTTTQAVFSALNTNGSTLFIQDYRTAAGADWTTAGKRIQEKIDSTWMGYMQFNGSNNNYGISFGTGASTTQSTVPERMRITSNGNVGIGTSSPSAKLHVFKSSHPNAMLARFENPTGEALVEIKAQNDALSILQFADAEDGNVGAIQYSHPDNSMRFKTSDAERMRITSTGNVGIGTSSPADKLVVQGDGKGILVRSNDFTISRLIPRGQTSTNWDKGLFSLYSGSTEAIRIDTAGNSWFDGGNVGIGTVVPEAKLQVNGEIRASIFKDGDDPNYYVNPSGALSAILAGALQIGKSSVSDGNISMRAFGTGADSGANITFNMAVGGGNANSFIAQIVPISYDSLASNNNSLNFKVGNWNNNADAGASKMSILSNGNVGIGTTDPDYKLEVLGTLGVSRTSGITLSHVYSTGSKMYGNTSNDIIFSTAEVSAPYTSTDRLTILNNGNVGIGTTNPSQILHVNGGTQLGNINATVNFNTVALKVVEGTISTGPTLGSGTVGAQAVLYSNGQFGMYTGVSNNGDTWLQSQRNDTGLSTYNILLNPSGGNVGIGTYSPSEKLDVNGYIKSNRLIVGGYGGYISNFYSYITTGAELRVGYGSQTSYAICRASSFIVSSDYRLKENLETLDNAINRLKNLKTYRFNWKSNPNGEKVDGFIAHELQEVIPEAVTGVKDEIGDHGELEYQGIDHGKIVPLLTASLKEAVSKIEILEAKLTLLENRLK